MPDLWFVAQKGQRFGPLLRSDVAELLRRGSLKHSALAWRPGMAEWGTIAGCIGLEEVASVDHATEAVEESAPQRSWGHPRWPAILFCLFAIAAAYALLYTYDEFYQFGPAAPFMHASLWGGAILITFIATWLVWRQPSSAMGWSWTGAKIVCVLALLTTTTFAVPFARVSMMMNRIVEARDLYADYDLSYDRASKRLFFEGNIGPDFAHRLGTLLTANASAETLVINSPGGLIDQAIAAAALIERRPNLAVEIDGECSSACFILFMAAQRREADALASFGFHRADMVTSVPAFVAEAAGDPTTELRAYVVRRGFPEDAFDELAQSEELRFVTAIELADMNIVTRLVSEGSAIDAGRAKWIWISAASEQGGHGFSELAHAFAESEDRMILDSGAAVFAAMRQANSDEARRLMTNLVSNLVPRVLESADPALAMTYIHASNASTEHLASTQNWQQCADAIDGKGLAPGAVPAAVLTSELAALAAAVRSANDAGWPQRALPSWAAEAGHVLVTQTQKESADRGLDVSRYDSDPRTRCLLSIALVRNAAQEESVRAAAAYRWIIQDP